MLGSSWGRDKLEEVEHWFFSRSTTSSPSLLIFIRILSSVVPRAAAITSKGFCLWNMIVSALTCSLVQGLPLTNVPLPQPEEFPFTVLLLVHDAHSKWKRLPSKMTQTKTHAERELCPNSRVKDSFAMSRKRWAIWSLNHETWNWKTANNRMAGFTSPRKILKQ